MRRSGTARGALLVLVFCWACSAVLAENIDPAGDGSQYAWGEWVGWLNAEPQGEGGPGVQVTDTALTGWIWAGESGWISLSCQNTSSCGVNDYGVVNDGRGNASGFAWGEHLGWINFGGSGGSDCCEANGTPGCRDAVCEALICSADDYCCNNNWDGICAEAASAEPDCLSSCDADPFGLQIHGFTGVFSGYVWSEHGGWINFGTSPTGASHQIETDWRCPDPDLDGVCTASDSCPTYSNPGQGTVRFDQTVRAASNKVDFVWDTSVDWQVVSGTFTLAEPIGDFALNSYRQGTGDIFSELIMPTPDHGYWYIWRVNCPAGSFSSGSPFEAGDRDGTLLLP